MLFWSELADDADFGDIMDALLAMAVSVAFSLAPNGPSLQEHGVFTPQHPDIILIGKKGTKRPTPPPPPPPPLGGVDGESTRADHDGMM